MIEHSSAQEIPGEKFPQICSLKKLSSSVVSGKPNSGTGSQSVLNSDFW